MSQSVNDTNRDTAASKVSQDGVDDDDLESGDLATLALGDIISTSAARERGTVPSAYKGFPNHHAGIDHNVSTATPNSSVSRGMESRLSTRSRADPSGKRLLVATILRVLVYVMLQRCTVLLCTVYVDFMILQYIIVVLLFY